MCVRVVVYIATLHARNYFPLFPLDLKILLVIYVYVYNYVGECLSSRSCSHPAAALDLSESIHFSCNDRHIHMVYTLI